MALHFEGGGVSAALEFGKALGRIAPVPGDGSTADLWEALATIASVDLGAARAIEPHLDALAILKQAKRESTSTDAVNAAWGVFAAEGADDPLRASEHVGRWSLTGVKPWCSLADRLDRALVTAHLADGRRTLFAVELRKAGVSVSPGQWHARGLAEIPSGPVRFSKASAVPVGEPDWYLTRPGFAWGGIGVAACWYGGAVGLARALFDRAGESPDPLLAAHLGAVDEQLQSARRALAEAARLIDADTSALDGPVLAKRVRATVVRACESVLQRVAHALGPAPLALNFDHAKRVADLELYIRQHHAERDDASLGTALAKNASSPW
jgi:alkylation response protein AidB-like acyl-CoA dehydrogenase